MELAIQNSICLHWESCTPAPRLPVRLLVVFVMLVGFTVVNVGAMALAGHATIPPNPFSSFADVFPGQPRSAVVARGFSCAMGTYPILPNEYCTLDPATEIFRQVGVVVSQGTINRTDFTLRENTLRLGDLVALWGITDFPAFSHHMVTLFWPGRGVSALAFSNSGQFSLFLPVWNVSFTDTGLPD